jgi:predicted DNA-binding transcriptional regulator AlpA
MAEVQANPAMQLLTESDVALILKTSIRTLQGRRLRREPPRWVKLAHNQVRYRLVDIQQYVDERLVETD